MMAERFIANYFARSWKTGVSIAVSLLFAIGDWRKRREKRLFTRMARNNDLFHSPRIFLRFLCILIERDV